MKRTLLHFVFNSISDQFPLLPRIRRSFIGLFMFCILLLIVELIGDISIPVKPSERGNFVNRNITAYGGASVSLSGLLKIEHPTLFQKILIPNSSINIDPLTLVLLAVISIIIVQIVPRLQQHNLFRQDISNAIRLTGYLLIFHSLISIYRIIIFIPQTVQHLTHDEFTIANSFPLLIFAEIYFALLVLALANVYKKGMNLQKEQDLTF